MGRLRIGQVARASGLSVETVRYYESRGLIETPLRSSSGYREYPQDVTERLAFIRRGKKLGFALEEIRELLDLQLRPGAESAAVKGFVEEKIELIEGKISELERLKQTLQGLSSLCDGAGPAERCPILGFLNAAEEAAETPGNCAAVRLQDRSE